MTPHHTHQPCTHLGTQKPGEKMSTNTKIYTAAEVASAGFSKEEVTQTLAKITKEAYEEAKRGKNTYSYYGSHINFLKEIARHLEELGYSVKITEKSISGAYLAFRWGNTNPTMENNK